MLFNCRYPGPQIDARSCNHCPSRHNSSLDRTNSNHGPQAAIQDSEAVVLPGAPLVDIGNPLDLEIVADLLSTDAVQIKAGAPVRIDGWGGQGD